MIFVQFVLLIGLLDFTSCGQPSSYAVQKSPTLHPNVSKSLTPNEDPLYQFQWHLKNIGQLGGLFGEDINVEPVWESCGLDSTCHGEGVTIVIVDDGVQIAHEDLVQNIIPGSHNYITGKEDPTPVKSAVTPLEMIEAAHGTAVAGLVAARDLNGLGGRGVAPRASLLGYDLLENESTFNDADAMSRGIEKISISVNSWGAPDGNGQLNPSDSLWQKAIDIGIEKGRNGLGTLYLWAAGNGDTGGYECPQCQDNANYDGQANYYGVIAVGSVNDQGKKSSYSDRGANILVTAPGGEFCHSGQAITTTDLMGDAGFNPNFMESIDYLDHNYTKCMNGTSASAPITAGVVALILQANPNLTWRDVRMILAQSARQNDPGDPGKTGFSGDDRDVPGWKINGAGYHINHNYGFGVVDAAAAVKLAKQWSLLPPLRISEVYASKPNLTIPDADANGITDTIHVSENSGSPEPALSHIEWVEVTFSSDHPYSGDLDIALTHSNTGTVSRLAEQHDCYSPVLQSKLCTQYQDWVFRTVRHLGESAEGDWSLTVRDLHEKETGTFQKWSLRFYGS